MYLMSQSRRGVPAKYIQRHFCVTYKAAKVVTDRLYGYRQLGRLGY